MTAWYDFPVTQAHNPPTEEGIDLGTPFHTPLTALPGGTVVGTGYYPWGGEVDIAAQLAGFGKVIESFLHLDQIDVSPGQTVSTGQEIGLSGGQLSGGAHPTGSQYSSGPHVEFDYFTGKPFASESLDPTAAIEAVRAGAGGTSGSSPSDPLLAGVQAGLESGSGAFPWLGAVAALTGPAQSATDSLQNGIAAAGVAVGGAINSGITQVGHGIADFLHAADVDVQVWIRRQAIAFAIAAVVLFVLFA
jgi:hypothetical protein